MTDDIVTRLREHADYLDSETKPYLAPLWMRKAADEIQRLQHACDYYHKMCSMIADKNFTANEEIEHLRNAIIRIEKAITDEGKVPSYHRATMKRHRKEWKTLHTAIDEAIKAVYRG